MLNWLAKKSIEKYWSLIPENKRKVCIYKTSCSNHVYNTLTKYGFFKGLYAYYIRTKNCNNYYKIATQNEKVFIITSTGEHIEEENINPVIVKEIKA